MMEDVDPMLRLFADLKGLKVSLDIDDFGIGYSSLRYLHRFPINSRRSTGRLSRTFKRTANPRRSCVPFWRSPKTSA